MDHVSAVEALSKVSQAASFLRSDPNRTKDPVQFLSKRTSGSSLVGLRREYMTLRERVNVELLILDAADYDGLTFTKASVEELGADLSACVKEIEELMTEPKRSQRSDNANIFKWAKGAARTAALHNRLEIYAMKVESFDSAIETYRRENSLGLRQDVRDDIGSTQSRFAKTYDENIERDDEESEDYSSDDERAPLLRDHALANGFNRARRRTLRNALKLSGVVHILTHRAFVLTAFAILLSLSFTLAILASRQTTHPHPSLPSSNTLSTLSQALTTLLGTYALLVPLKFKYNNLLLLSTLCTLSTMLLSPLLQETASLVLGWIGTAMQLVATLQVGMGSAETVARMRVGWERLVGENLGLGRRVREGERVVRELMMTGGR